MAGTPLTRDEVIKAVSEVDDVVVAGLVGLGVTAEELAEARTWVESDEALVNSGKPLPSGRVGQVVEFCPPSTPKPLISWRSGSL